MYNLIQINIFMKDVPWSLLLFYSVTRTLTWNIPSPDSRNTQNVKSILGKFGMSSPSLHHTSQLYVSFALLCFLRRSESLSQYPTDHCAENHSVTIFTEELSVLMHDGNVYLAKEWGNIQLCYSMKGIATCISHLSPLHPDSGGTLGNWHPTCYGFLCIPLFQISQCMWFVWWGYLNLPHLHSNSACPLPSAFPLEYGEFWIWS